ncbi:MAG: leucine-rich repeat protein [Prevotellaceae bacterium]|jgi:Flp pilus assembly protein protease CpaA|nr:leucine-rich repeat protein [Prevotellaceae bacterium]
MYKFLKHRRVNIFGAVETGDHSKKRGEFEKPTSRGIQAKAMLMFVCLLFAVNSFGQTWQAGENITATLSNGTLTFSGTGAMDNYNYSSTPWYGVRSNISTVIINNGITSIGYMAFTGCSGLTSLTIPNSVTSIGLAAFSVCSGLTSLAIPNSVTSIGSGAFSGCSGLTSLTIPNSVTSIGSGAFSYCSGLTSLTISNSVTAIGDSLFSGCSGLTSLTIPNSVTSIGYMAFTGCSGLTSLIIPNSVTSIGFYAFSGCRGLTVVTIGSNVTSIGGRAFYYCDSLLEIHSKNTTPPTTGDYYGNAFENVTKTTCKLYVPVGSTDAYMSANEWKDFINIFEENGNIPPTLSVSDSCTFSASGGTTTITITSNQSWTVQNNVSWLTVSQTGGSNNGTFTVTATANTSASWRNATITVTGGGITRTIPVWQESAPLFNVSPDSCHISASGGTTTITVTSNQSWTVQNNASWLTVSQTGGSNNGTFTITATTNTSASQRSANITVTGGGITRTITVYQAPAVMLSVLPDSCTFSANGGTTTITITSNQSWTVQNNASWLIVSQTGGSNNGTFTITATTNTSASQRSANITVTGGGITRTITVYQAPAVMLSVLPDSCTFSANGGTTTITVTSNQSWTVQNNASWLTVSQTGGGHNGILITDTTNITAAANTSTSQRNATVTITGGGITRTILVHQAPAAMLSFSSDSSMYIFGADGGTTSAISVVSNQTWTVSVSNTWLAVSRTEGSNNGIFTITAAKNTSIVDTLFGYVFVTGGGITKTITVQVLPASVPVTGVNLSLASLLGEIDGSDTLTATVQPANASNKTVTWSSSDTGVATVNNGMVNFVGIGTATITVTTQDGAKNATCTVTVEAQIPVPVFDGLQREYSQTNTSIPLKLKGKNAENFTVFKVNGEVKTAFVPDTKGVFLIEAFTSDGKSKIETYIKVN